MLPLLLLPLWPPLSLPSRNRLHKGMDVQDKNLIAVKTAELLFTEMSNERGLKLFSALLRAQTDMSCRCKNMLNSWAKAAVIDAQMRDWYLDYLKQGVRDDDNEVEEGEDGEEETSDHEAAATTEHSTASTTTMTGTEAS